MFPCLLIVALMNLEQSEPVAPSQLEGNWIVLAEGTFSPGGKVQGVSTNHAKAPVLTIAKDRLTVTSSEKKRVVTTRYGISRSDAEGAFLLTEVGRKASPIKVSFTLDGDVLKVSQVLDKKKGGEEGGTIVPGLPPYFIVHPYWRGVAYVAKREKLGFR